MTGRTDGHVQELVNKELTVSTLGVVKGNGRWYTPIWRVLKREAEGRGKAARKDQGAGSSGCPGPAFPLGEG